MIDCFSAVVEDDAYTALLFTSFVCLIVMVTRTSHVGSKLCFICIVYGHFLQQIIVFCIHFKNVCNNKRSVLGRERLACRTDMRAGFNRFNPLPTNDAYMRHELPYA